MSGPATALQSAIEFWFDFASPYAYFSALEIDAVATRHGREVIWRPFTLGAVFKLTGAKGLSSTPLKKDYAARDWARIASFKGLPFRLPNHHPSVGLPAIRAFYYLDRKDALAAALLAKTLIVDYFTANLDIDDPHAVANVGRLIGLDPEMLLAGINDPDVKQTARRHAEAAIARGVFGSPWFFVDDEPFWGHDRLPMLEQWLAQKAA